MTQNEEEELLALTRDNNRILKYIYNILSSPTDDMKDFVMNVIANLVANG